MAQVDDQSPAEELHPQDSCAHQSSAEAQVRSAMATTAEAVMAVVEERLPAEVHVDICLHSSLAFLRQWCCSQPAAQLQLMHWVYRYGCLGSTEQTVAGLNVMPVKSRCC